MNEASNRPWWATLASSVRQLPTDLGAVVAAVLVVDALLLLHVIGGGLQFVLGAPLLLFLPGYVVIAILFPARGRPSVGAEGTRARIGGAERVALSFASSLAVLMLYALVVAAAAAPFDPTVVLGGLTVFVVGGALVGGARRLSLPERDRFRVPVGRWYDATAGAIVHPVSRVDGVLNLVLAASVVLAVGTFGYALAVPAPSAGYTDFQLRTENGAGDLVASGYPSTVTAGEAVPLVATVTNHEGSAQTYTVVVELQRVRATDGSVTVLEERELDRTRQTVGAGERWNWRHEVVPPVSMLGDDLRLEYTLYRGDAPDDPTAADAYRDLHVWLSVQES